MKMKKIYLLSGLALSGVLAYLFLKRKPEQLPTKVSKPPIPDSPSSKPSIGKGRTGRNPLTGKVSRHPFFRKGRRRG